MVNRLKISALSMVIVTLFFYCNIYIVKLFQHEQEAYCKKQKRELNLDFFHTGKKKVNTKNKQVIKQIIEATINGVKKTVQSFHNTGENNGK